jgi:hypothetical protein
MPLLQGEKGETSVLRSTGGVQAEYSGVQVEYVKYGGVLEYRSLAFSPLLCSSPDILKLLD